MKRLIVFLLAVLLVFSLAACSGGTEPKADEQPKSTDLYSGEGWKIQKDGTMVLGPEFKMNENDRTVPWSDACSKIKAVVVEEGVTEIPEGSFLHSNAVSVTLPSSLKVIGAGAFSNCRDLKSIEIPAGVVSIGNGAFKGCVALESLELPQGITEITASLFQDCGLLKNLTIPEGVTAIGEKAFFLCASLESLHLPAGVASLGTFDVFSGCSALAEITVDDNNPAFSDKDGILFNKEQTKLIKWPAKHSATEYTISADMTFGNQPFESCTNLKTVYFDADVKEIPKQLFYGCKSLEAVTIPDGVSSLGDAAFFGCESLKTVVLGKGLTVIAGSAFEACTSLEKITIPGNVVDVEDRAFARCTALKTVVIESGVRQLMNEVFLGTYALESLTIPASVTKIYLPLGVGANKIDRSNLTIYGEAGSEAEWYAGSEKIKFAVIS